MDVSGLKVSQGRARPLTFCCRCRKWIELSLVGAPSRPESCRVRLARSLTKWLRLSYTGSILYRKGEQCDTALRPHL